MSSAGFLWENETGKPQMHGKNANPKIATFGSYAADKVACMTNAIYVNAFMMGNTAFCLFACIISEMKQGVLNILRRKYASKFVGAIELSMLFDS
jgi:hypothetical protein